MSKIILAFGEFGATAQTKSGRRSSLISCQSVAECGIAPGSDSVQPGFAGPDADRLFDIGDENLAVADAPGLRGAPDRVDGALDQIIADHDLDLHLGQEVDDVFCAAVELGMTLLAAKTLGLGHRDALKADFLKRFLHLVELERLDDGFDFLHCAPPGLIEQIATSSSGCAFLNARSCLRYAGIPDQSGNNGRPHPDKCQ